MQQSKLIIVTHLLEGRKIFGGVVPFNQIWRTGASNCTKLITNEEVVL
jgi:hypothetical protein